MKQLNQQIVVGKENKSVDRNFFEVSRDNTENSNLTELCASTSVIDNGFVRHSDWLGHITRYAYALKMLEKHEPATLLDVGCGKMQMIHYFWRNRYRWAGFKYWGIDLRATPAWYEDIGIKSDLNLVRMDIVNDTTDEIPTWPGQFDMTVSFEAFEHVPVTKQPEFMRRLFNWTKPGGLCLFSTPNAGVATTVADNHKDPETGEVRERTYEEKIALAEAAGFTIEDTFGVFCGYTRLPETFQEELERTRTLGRMKEFLDLNLFNTVISAGYPEEANNALFVMSRP